MLKFTEAVTKYKDDIFRLAFSFLKSADALNDIVQEVFLKYLKCDKEFESDAHLKNWLLKVAANGCKKELISPFRKRTVPVEDYLETLAFETPEESELMLSVMKLTANYRSAIHLYYFEDYSVKEISKILGIKESTIQSRLLRGRQQLKI